MKKKSHENSADLTGQLMQRNMDTRNIPILIMVNRGSLGGLNIRGSLNMDCSDEELTGVIEEMSDLKPLIPA